MNKRSLSQRTRSKYGAGNYRGVHWAERAGKWQVAIRVNGKNKHFGSFEDEEDGLTAVNAAYAEHFPDNPELQQVTRNKRLKELNLATCGKWV